MSGAQADTSTTHQRQQFCDAVAHGGGPALMAAAAAVANCHARLPEMTAYTIGMEHTTTYARAVDLMRMRLASGRAPL